MAHRQGNIAARLLAALALLLGAVLPPPAEASPPEAREYEVKAAFLYNFTKFVTWADPVSLDPAEPFVIAVIGDDPFGPALSALARKTAQGRPIAVRRVSDVESLKSCRMLFVSPSVGNRLPEILRAAHARHILTVGDTERFAARGGIIELVLQGNRVGFEINVEAARGAGLSISSKLLSLARSVHRGSGP